MTNAANALVGVTGAVYKAPSGTTQPTDNTTALNVAYKDLGYVSDNGVTQKINTSTTQIKAWQNGDIVREVQTSHDLTYQFTLIETTSDTLKAFYGDANVTGASPVWDVAINGQQGFRGCWVLEMEDGTNPTVRVVVPDGQVTARGDVIWKSDTVVQYDVTITCYPDASKNKAYIYGG